MSTHCSRDSRRSADSPPQFQLNRWKLGGLGKPGAEGPRGGLGCWLGHVQVVAWAEEGVYLYTKHDLFAVVWPGLAYRIFRQYEKYALLVHSLPRGWDLGS